MRMPPAGWGPVPPAIPAVRRGVCVVWWYICVPAACVHVAVCVLVFGKPD